MKDTVEFCEYLILLHFFSAHIVENSVSCRGIHKPQKHGEVF